jgi:predicted nucleic acid-binding protein
VNKTEANARIIESSFRFLPDDESVYREWRRIVVAFSVSGVQVHDARLAATMYAHGITDILTLNRPDFARFAGLQAIDPNRVSAP